MRWKCFMVERKLGQPEGLPAGGMITRPYWFLGAERFDYSTLPVGAMWLRDGKLWVFLPGRTACCIDDTGTNGARWTRTGDPPEVTVTPSINYVGLYHGWVKDGYVTDDVEDRKFDDTGRPLQSK